MKRLFKKAFLDLFGNRARLFTALLAIVLGSVVFGGITFTYHLLQREIGEVFTATNPASGSLLVDRVDDNLLALTEDFSGIDSFEAKATHELRMERTDGTHKSLLLFSAPALAAGEINKLRFLDGSESPASGEILIEQDALGVAGAGLGETIPIRLPDGGIREYQIAGTLNDLSQHPSSMHNQVYAYVEQDALADMGLTMNRIDYFVDGERYNRAHILQVTSDYIRLLEENGYAVHAVNISNTPGVSMHLPEYEGALFIFQVFSVLAFLFGCIIMSSLLSTILSGQVRQIGILKSMGAKTGNILISYMGAALLLVMCNLALSLPLSLLAARGLSVFFMSLGNMKMVSFALPGSLLALFSAATLAVPLVLAFLPVRRGLSVAVKNALADHGGQATAGAVRGPARASAAKLPRPVLLSIRGAVAHRRRFAMNLSMLTLGGLLFVGMMGSIVSINAALSDNLAAQHFDYQVTTGSYRDGEKAEGALRGLDTVTGWESWGATTGQLVYSQGGTGNLYSVMAPPHDTAMLSPELMQGRWLQAGDSGAVVVSFEFLNLEEGFALGDTISLRFGDTTRELSIVGVIKEIGNPGIYMNREGFEALVPTAAQRGSVKITTAEQRGSKRGLYQELEVQLAAGGVTVVQAESRQEQFDILSSHFTTTLVSFLVVAVMAVCVAGFGLASTMSVQIAERTREIGVMKSMGASEKQIRSIVMAESSFISLLSWAVSLVLGAPVTALAIYVIGVHVLQIPLALSPAAILLALLVWLALTLLVGRLSGRASAKRAAQLPVKAALALE